MSSDNLKKGPVDMKQLPVRLHVNDHRELKSKVALDGIKIQTLIEAIVMRYLDGDEYIKKMVLDFKESNKVNKSESSWSKREKENLLSEIETLDEK